MEDVCVVAVCQEDAVGVLALGEREAAVEGDAEEKQQRRKSV